MHLRDGPRTHETVALRYASLVDTGALKADLAQQATIVALDRLSDAIAARSLARKSSALGWLFARKPDASTVPKGLYIHGGVGRGKTMLMDMFFAVVPIKSKRRLHFNAFMVETHDRIQKHRQARKDGTTSEDDPIPPVARAIATDAQLLCFDEFSVTDITDAMILSRLFRALFAEGVVLVATSNVAPDDLYRDGLNRGLFEPFIGLLKQHADIIGLDSDTDYRLEKLNRLPVYISPLGPDADRLMDEAWATATDGKQTAPSSIPVKGREIVVPAATADAARFSFADLCEKPLAARDYLAIAERYSTVFVDRVPLIGDGKRNEAKRLILLVDTLYDRRVRLFVSAEAEPDRLYAVRSGTEAFEFARTVSRLAEMRGAGWVDAWKSARSANVATPATANGSLQGSEQAEQP